MKQLVVAVLLLLSAGALALRYGPAGADTVGAPIAVGTNPQQEQLSPDGTKLYVSNEGTLANCPYPAGTVSVINTMTSAVMAVGGGVNPGPIRFTPDGSKAYVVNQSDCNPNGSVSVISAASGTVLTTVAVGKLPVTLSVAKNGSKVYVANKGASSNSISVICTGLVPAVCSATDTVIKTIALDQNVAVQPHVLAKNPSGSELWVAEQDCPAVFGCTSSNVAVISTTSDSVIANISVGPTAGSIHFTPDGSRAYVATRGNGSMGIAPTVVDISASSHTVSHTVPIKPPGFPTDASPHSIRLTPDGSKVYVVNKHANDVAVICTGKVPGVCAATDSVLSYIPVGDSPVRMELTDSGGRAYVVNEAPTLSSGTLSAICTGLMPCGGSAADTVMSTLTLGGKPIDLEINCLTNTAYVSNSGSNTVSVVTLTGSGTCSAASAPTPTSTPTPTATPPGQTATPTAPATPPGPTSSATASPTPQPGIQVLWGDEDCSGDDSSIDALQTLRRVAQLPVEPAQGCPAIGSTVNLPNSSPHLWGDVDCSGDVSSVDALQVLRFVAALPLTPVPGCPGVGASTFISFGA